MATTWRKRGRPKLNRPSNDSGTPELQARRSALVGAGDPVLAEYPLGIMLARGLISAEQHEAGCYYATLYAKAVARTTLSCAHIYRRMLAESGKAQELDDKSQEHIERLFRHGKNRLLAAGRRVCEATENLAVFGRAARFLHNRSSKASRCWWPATAAAPADAGGWRPIAPRASHLRWDAGRGPLEILSLTHIGIESHDVNIRRF